jgi:hypothetical protein
MKKGIKIFIGIILGLTIFVGGIFAGIIYFFSGFHGQLEIVQGEYTGNIASYKADEIDKVIIEKADTETRGYIDVYLKDGGQISGEIYSNGDEITINLDGKEYIGSFDEKENEIKFNDNEVIRKYKELENYR